LANSIGYLDLEHGYLCLSHVHCIIYVEKLTRLFLSVVEVTFLGIISSFAIVVIGELNFFSLHMNFGTLTLATIGAYQNYRSFFTLTYDMSQVNGVLFQALS
jgi:hypothetical protein